LTSTATRSTDSLINPIIKGKIMELSINAGEAITVNLNEINEGVNEGVMRE
jgi:hypothetical protein